MWGGNVDLELAYNPARWSTFFSAEVGATAALTGLLFVSISINLSKIVSNPLLASRSAKALGTLAGVLVASTLCLVPGLSRAATGWTLTILGGVTWLLISYWQLKASRRNPYASFSHTLLHWILAEASVLPLLICGISLLLVRGGGLYWLVVAIVVSFVAALLDAWVLLIEIQR
jgi:hypothetical protein